MTPCSGRRAWAILLAGLLTAISAAPVRAAGNYNAKIMLHALLTTTKNHCARAANVPTVGCVGYDVSSGPLYPPGLFVYALVVDGSQAEGIGGASFGIDYDAVLQSGVDVWSWTNCGNSELPAAGWPAPGGGNTISFTTPGNCQTAGNPFLGAVAALGHFYCGAYTTDLMAIIPHPEMSTAVVVNCADAIDEIIYSPYRSCSRLGQLGFGPGQSGWNPCGRELPIACFPCTFDGPATVTAGELDIVYKSDAQASKVWSITGNGTIVGSSTETEVHVNAGAPGTFMLSVQLTFDSSGEHVQICRKTVTVQDAVPAVPVSWGRIKSLTLSGP